MPFIPLAIAFATGAALTSLAFAGWQRFLRGRHCNAVAAPDAATGATREIRRRLENLRQDLETSLDRCISMSEDDVTATGDHVRVIFNDTKTNAELLQKLFARLGVTNSLDQQKDGVGHAIQVQTALFEAFSLELKERIGAQAGVAGDALEITRSLQASAEDVRRIASAVRTLTLNARIEAARLGEHGRGFVALSSQMLELSQSVQQASRALSSMAEGIGRQLPDLAAALRDLADYSTQFGGRLSEETDRLRAVYKETHAESLKALEISQDSAHRTAIRANTVFRHLQFQDRMAQELRRIEGRCRAFEEFVRAIDSGMAPDHAANTVRTEERLESFLDRSAPDLQGGDIELF